MTSPPRHVIFGTGAIGLATLDALLRRGETVRMINRFGTARVPDEVEVVAGNAADPQFTIDVTRGAQVVYQTMNPPYERWVEEFPALQAGVLAAAEAHGARLVSMENVYMYGRPAGRPLIETRDYAAHTTKGKLRGQMATELLDAHQAGRVAVAIGRASDYFGPGGGAQSNLGDRLFPAALAGKAASVLGDPDQPHTYTYIPDIGEGLAVLGEHPDALGQVWHLPNDPNTHTTRQLVDVVFQLAGQPRTRLRQVKPLMIRIAALTNRTLRELPEMQYQFEEPFIVDSSKIANNLGLHATPVEQALADTLATYRTAASGRHPQSSRPFAVETMTAIVHDDYGTVPEDVLRLEEVDKPTIADDQVLVRVHAASVDRGTWHIMAGLPYPIRAAGFGLRKPKYLNPGRSLAGTVEAVGKDVTGFNPDDEVFGICDGSFAEYVGVQTDKLAPKPSNLSFEEAASVPISGLTALQAVRDHGEVQAGQKVLVVGASGGVGSFAVQIAKAFGAEVTGVCSTAKVDLVRALGADHVIDYSREDFADGQQRYDVILDIGGNRRLSDLRRALTPKGRLVIVGGETDGRWLGGTDRQLRAQLLSLFVSQKLGTFISSENAADLIALRELIEAGRIKPVIDRTYPLSDVATAIRDLIDGRARGKIVITV